MVIMTKDVLNDSIRCYEHRSQKIYVYSTNAVNRFSCPDVSYSEKVKWSYKVLLSLWIQSKFKSLIINYI